MRDSRGTDIGNDKFAKYQDSPGEKIVESEDEWS